jgi:hypothetical protein
MLEEHGFSGGVRGKDARRYADDTHEVVKDPDVAEYFPDHDAVDQFEGWPLSSRERGSPNPQVHADVPPRAGELQRHRHLAAASIATYGGRYRVRAAAAVVVEGEPTHRREESLTIGVPE